MTVRIETEGGEATDPVGGIAVFVVASETGVTGFENRGYDFERRTETLYADGVASNSTTGRNRAGGVRQPRLRHHARRDVPYRIDDRRRSYR